MEKRLTVGVLGLMVSVFSLVCGLRADPYVGYVYPSGIQAGTKLRVLVGGQGFGENVHGWVSGDGVSVVDVERVPAFTRAAGDGQRQWLDKWLRNLEDGVTTMPELPKDEVLRNWPRNRWWETLDKLDLLALSLVRRDHYQPRPDPLQAAPAIAERLILTIAADKTASSGLRHLVLYNSNAASAQHPFFVTAESHVAEPLYEAPPPPKAKRRSARAPVVSHTPVVLDGQILPGETDVFRLALTRGEQLTCLLDGRELMPYLGDTVPGFFNPVLRLTDEDGTELAFADDYGFLPDPVLTCDIPKTGTYLLEVRDNLYRGRDDFVYAVSCFTDSRLPPKVQERAFRCNVRLPVRGEFTGMLSNPGASVHFDFEVKEPGRVDVELFARRLGSSLDGVVRLYGPLKGWFWADGPLLATWDDVTNRLHVGSVPQAECDSVGSWDFKDAGEYRISVEDRVGGGGVGYDFTLDLRPSEPDFEVYALKDSMVIRPWKDSKAVFKVKVVRLGGFAGEITVVGNADFVVEKGAIPAGKEEAEIVVVPKKRNWTGVKRASFTAVAEVSAGKTLTHLVVPGHEVEQAFAYTHVLPAEEFLFFMRPAFSGSVSPPEWIEMPYDRFLPLRVISSSIDFSAYRSECRKGLDALADVDVSLLTLPRDAGDGVLAAKFASSAAQFRKRNRGVFAYEPSEARDDDAARAVLAGCVGFVSPKALQYEQGDERRVRTMARALAQPPDNDMLFYVPSELGDPLTGRVGESARRLRDSGWCYDFVTDKTITNAPVGRVHRAVYLTVEKKQLPEDTRRFLDEKVVKRGVAVVYGEALSKDVKRKLAAKTRREEMPKDLRFARFGRTWGEGWYFVHNPTATQISGEASFRIRGTARSAYLMDIRTGAVVPMEKNRAGKFRLALEAGGSAWIYATTAERKHKTKTGSARSGETAP